MFLNKENWASLWVLMNQHGKHFSAILIEFFWFMLLKHRFVSDYALNGFKALCQHKLLHAMQKCHLGPEAARTYPLSLLEWTANRKKAHMALQVHCLDGTAH